ncbi:hypothetical protein BDZ89DRAFT_1090120 [Hymenopellis radicata]|nr:hypothetical protein BDZ89DRAFT_1090120 [Hymenopellis radicata]
MKIVDDAKLPHRNRVRSSIAKDIWSKFLVLAVERRMVALHATAVKGKFMTCDNVKCQKIDEKNNFQKCAGCQTTLYCSKACQTLAWKEGGHKSMCKMKQQERREGKLQSITKSDSAFFHDLATRDAFHHRPLLQRLAQKEHPNVKHSEFIICIDYTVLPPKYSLSLLADYEKDQPKMSLNGSTNAEARNDSFVERARQHPGKFTLIQSRISNGTGTQLVTSVRTGNFWHCEDDSFPPASDSEEDDMGDSEREEYRNRDTNVDAVDFSRARLIINSIAASLGQTTDL